MSDALDQLKRNSNALRQAYADRGGTFQHRDHSPCIFCGDASGFAFLDSTKDGLARWRCFAGKSDKCAARAGSNTAGTIVDLIARADGIDDSAAVKVALQNYGRQTGMSAPPTASVQQQKKKGKLHLTPDLAFEAAKWGMMQRPGLVSAELVKVWKYCDEQGEPRIEVGRFNVSKKQAGEPTGMSAAPKKEFAPIHRDGNGWRVGLGPYGKEKKAPLYRLPELLKALG